MATVFGALVGNPNNYIGLVSLIYDVLLCIFAFVKYNANYQGKRFRVFALVVTLASLVETIWPALVALDNTPVNLFLKRFVNSISYVGSTGVAFTFIWYLDSFLKTNIRFRRLMSKVNLYVYLFYIVFCLINIWTSWIVGYDVATNTFVHGPMYIAVGYGVPMYFLVYALAIFVKDIRQLDSRVIITMVSSILIAALAMAFQPLLYNKVRLIVLGVSLAMILWYLSIENYDTQRLVSMTKQLQTAEQKALEASLAKNTFLANMSHEIRTPMNAVLGLDEMILKSTNKEEIDEYARTIQGAGKTLLSIINDILDFSKIETGRLEFVAEPYELGELIEDVNQLMIVRAEQKELEFRIKIDETLPNFLVGDEMRVRQIMLNLLNNAIKYTEKGYVQLSITGVPRGEMVMLKIAIKDSGIGIKEEDIKHLFKSFERLDETRHHSVEGAGLGLAIVQQLLELMGGEVKVESEYGKGSTFTVYLPQEIKSQESIAEARKKAEEKKKQEEIAPEQMIAPDAKVLVVDDNRVNLMVAKGLLKDTLVQVTTCESGKACLKLIAENHYDIIFLDHMMPDMDGMETFRKMQTMEGNLNRDVPVVVFTANAMAGMKEQYLAVGFTDYISKPIDSKRFKTVLFKHIPQNLQGCVSAQKTQEVELEELPQEDGPMLTINQQAGMELCGGTKDVYQSVLSIFVEEKQTNRPKLVDFYEAENWKDYGILAHALKSNSKLVGCPEFAELALQMERSCDGDASFARQNHMDFLDMYDQLETAIKDILSQA